MTGFNFADYYRAAGLTAGPDVLKTRQEPFDKLRQAIDPPTTIDLTRLYFGLPVPRGTDWFRDAFGETDASFSLIDNSREASVLAAGLLEAGASDGKVYAALAILTAAARGARQPLVRAELIDAMRFSVQSASVKARQQAPADPRLIRLPAASKLAADLAALTQAPDITKACALIKQVSDESAENTKVLANQVFGVVQPLAAQVLTLREEVEMLWWHIGGWSRLLNKPFAELDLGSAALLSGIDMAEMSRSATGPAAAPAILQRTLSVGRQDRTSKITIKDAIDALSQEQLDQLKFPDALGNLSDICPLLTAVAKAKEIGIGSAWYAPFAKATGLEVGVALAPLDLAIQAFHERLLLKTLG